MVKPAKSRLRPRSLVGSYRRLSHYMLAQHRALVLVAVCMAAAAVLELLRPWPIKIVFDVILIPQENAGAAADAMRDIFGAGDALLAVCATSIFLVAVLVSAASFAETTLLAGIGQNVIAAIRLDLYRHVQALSQSFHDTTSAGDLLTRLTGDVRMLRDLLVNAVMFIGARALVFAGMLTVMLLMDWQLTLVALSVLPALALTSGYFVSRVKAAARRQRKSESRIAHVLTENLSAIRIVQAFAREPIESSRFSQRNQSSAKAEIAATREAAFLDRLVKIFVAAGTCGVVWFGVTRVQAGALTPGDLLVFTTYLAGLYKPVRKTAELMGKLAKAGVRAERIIEILDLEPEVRDRPGALTAEGLRGDIRIVDLSFLYTHSDDVLRTANLRIAPGETIALMSKSGAGKSTIAHLLLRFYDPLSGSIEIDGQDIRDYRIASLREQVSVLLQDTMLFNASIRDNIGYGKLDASDEEIEAAAKAADAHDFIMSLPDGYDTIVGPRGGTLSGGQRQRIAIARALVKDAPIVILDEPMTGLDAKTGQAVRVALAHLIASKTCILITHELSTAVLADRIIEIRNGQLVDATAEQQREIEPRSPRSVAVRSAAHEAVEN